MKLWKVLIAQVVLAAVLVMSVFGSEITQQAAEKATVLLPETAAASPSYVTAKEDMEVCSVFASELTQQNAEKTTVSLSGAAAASPSYVVAKEDMEAYFAGKGCQNTSTDKIETYWDMMAMLALDQDPDTETNYSAMNFGHMGIQALSTTVIAMISDDEDPAKYKVGKLDLVQYLRLCMGEDGGFVNGSASGDFAATYYQVYPIMALAMCDVTVPQTAADWFSSNQDADGILGYSWGGDWYADYDTTCWALIACDMAGIAYPKAESALNALAGAMKASGNSNSYACYLDLLAYRGEATKNHVKYLVNQFYNAGTKKFTFYGTDNEYATQQCAMALGECLNNVSVYELLDQAYTYGKDVDKQTVSVRIMDAVSSAVTNDLVPRVKLNVTAGASAVLSGTTAADVSGSVSVLDAVVEAVCYEKTGKDPSYADLVTNSAYINEKIAVASSLWGLGFTKVYPYEDGNFGYYLNQESCWGPTDPITKTSCLDLFHYDYTKASYAVFDASDYEGKTDETVKVQVKKAGYDASWNVVYTAVPALVKAVKDGTEKTFQCDADGYASISGLTAGLWKLTASYGTEDAYIVQPYAELKVTQAYVPSDDGSSSGSTATEKPAKTGTWNDPVTDGTWSQASDGSWTYKTNALFRSTWGYILNPYSTLAEKNFWFYFDANGKMLTGWQVIGNRWYYLNPSSETGTKGACLLNTTTPDGYAVDANGAWTVNGVVQEVAAQATTVTASSGSSSSGSGSSGSSSSGSSSSSSGSSSEASKQTTGSVSVSISANATKTDGEKVSFSASGKYSMEEAEGENAYDVLVRLCDAKGWSVEGSSSYVSAINGLAEFDCGSQSGWMYSVNGKYPNVSAGEYTVKKGDRIVWKYVTGMQQTTDDF